ncbi:MAG: ketol-acid reductoisomerase [Candidatus Bathyarchaeia archaeon]
MKKRTVYFDEDISLEPLKGKIIGTIGYGHQGRAQSLNLRDNGLQVIVGDLPEARKLAEDDGFTTYTVSEAADKADIILFLVPDEVMPEVYDKHIAPHLTNGKVLDFASGYTINFGLIIPPPNVDVVMNAPRMPGEMVRERFMKGLGNITYIDVKQDYSGKAWDIVKAIAKGTGCTKVPGGGAYEATFAEEVELDLFMEQAVLTVIDEGLSLGAEVLVEAGYPPEAAVVELWGSSDTGEYIKKLAEYGLMKTAYLLASRAALYGFSWAKPKMFPKEKREELKARMREILDNIKDGTFVRDMMLEEKVGLIKLKKERELALKHPISEYEVNASRLFRKSIFSRVEDFDKLIKLYKRM